MTSRQHNSRGAAKRWRGRRGIALLSVLWVLTLLAVMAATYTRVTRTDTNLARNLVENVAAEALADAGVHLTIAKLLQPLAEDGWTIDGRVHELSFDDGTVRVKIADEGGKIDLNLAAEPLLSALFEALDRGPSESAALADAIADFRDPDDLRRLNGAEDEDYAAADLDFEAKDGPFALIAELRQVIGMTPELYEQVAPVLTVHSRRRVPNEATAPPLVAAALKRQRLVQSGEQPDEAEPEPEDEPVFVEEGDGEATRGLRSRQGLYAIHAEAKTDTGASFVRDAVLRLTGNPNLPFQVLAWDQGRRSPAASGPADN